MAVILDIVGMLAIRASIIMIILNLIINMHEALYKNTERIYLNETITAPAQTISADLKLAGYNSANKNFPVANLMEMSFRSDYDNNGSVDIIRYYLNTTSGSVPYKILYRSINGGSVMEVARDVTTFNVRYYRADASTVTGTDVPNIKSVSIRLIIGSRNTESGLNEGTSESAPREVRWEEHFFPENL